MRGMQSRVRARDGGDRMQTDLKCCQAIEGADHAKQWEVWHSRRIGGKVVVMFRVPSGSLDVAKSHEG